MFSVLASEVFSGIITLSEPTQDLIWINKTKSCFGKIEQVNLYKSEEILSLGVDKSISCPLQLMVIVYLFIRLNRFSFLKISVFNIEKNILFLKKFYTNIHQ